MKTKIFIRLLAAVLIILIGACAFDACGSPGDHGSSEVDIGENTGTAVTAVPGSTEEVHPDWTEAPQINETPDPESSLPAESAEPVDQTDDPAAPTADPEQSSQPSEPAYTLQPGVTAAPTASAQPGNTVQPGTTASPAASVTPTTPVPVSTPSYNTPVPAATPTPRPTATPAPDPVTTLTAITPGTPVYCDMDFDGDSEKVELSLKKRGEADQLLTVKVTVGGSQEVLVDSFGADEFVKAYLNNFNSGDNRVELIVSAKVGSRDASVRCYRLNQGSNGLMFCETEGKLESVQGNSATIGKYVDIMGTWYVTAVHNLSYDSFSLVPTDGEWTVKQEPNRWCTVSNTMLVGLYISGPENYAGFIERGDKLYPTLTNLTDRIDFITDTNVSGYISVTFNADGAALYDEVSMDNWFSDLTYIP